MTDHFKDCKPGDVVKVEIKGEFDRDPHGVPWVGHNRFDGDEIEVLSVTVEPKPLAVGDKVRMRPSTTIKPNAEWIILGLDEGHVWIKRFSDGNRMLARVSDLERAQ